MTRPSFDELPLRKDDPPFSAWGLYGLNDELGTLNLLTPDVVKDAAKEIQTGVRVALDHSMNRLAKPSHNRAGLKHTLIPGKINPTFDDTIELNTQVSTQWDGFRHVGYRKSGLFYNDTTKSDINGPNARPTRLGTQAWVNKGGIVGRGVLLDYLRWTQSQNETYDLMANHAITAEDLQACAKSQKVTFRTGDILFVRSGFSVGYAALGEEEKVAWASKPTAWIGVDTSAETARWLWDTGFSACAGDAPGWESFPIWCGRTKLGGADDLSLHEVMLGGWGMPIGEMFDLERLSEECMNHKRYSFFVSSMPIHIPGGVGSPPNAVAIF